MKFTIFFFTIITVVCLIRCKDELVEPVNTEKCNIDIGSYHLLPSSLNSMPYFDKSSILFVDFLNNQAEFKIFESDLYTSHGVLYRYNVHEQGDTIKYCYASERKGFNLSNSLLGISLGITLEASAYYSDPESGNVADILDIFYNNLSDSISTSWQVFYKMVDQRTYPNPYSSNDFFSTISFLGREFHDVERSQFGSPKLLIYYNQTEGIVAFRDKSKTLWRFDSMH